MTVVPRSALEREMQSEIVCMCGTCGRKRVGECTCATAAEMRAEIATQVASGADREKVVQYFVTKYGSQEVLAAPIDQGFNRLAWLLPYGVGLAGVMMIGTLALRWSRRPVAAAPTPSDHGQPGPAEPPRR